MATEALVQRLAAHAMLGGVPREELEWLAAHGTLRVLAPGEILSPKGVRVEQMSIILSGHVAMMVDRGAGPRKTREWRGGEVPSVNGHTTALGLAKLYGAFARGEGLSRTAVDRARAE